MCELADALILAEKVLNKPNLDPDSDLLVLARQLMRLAESVERITELRGDGTVRFNSMMEPRQIARFIEKVRGARITAHAKSLHHDD